MKTRIANTLKVGLALLALCGVMLFAKTTHRASGEGFREALRIEREAPDRSGSLGGFSAVVERVTPSVVSIYTEKKMRLGHRSAAPPFFSDPFFKRFFGEEFDVFSGPRGDDRQERPQPRELPRQNGLGSGVVMTADGYIVTNNHVIDGADEIKVRFPDKKRDYKAEVVGRDSSTDLAVLKVEAEGLTPATLGDSGLIKVGDMVLAVGNPFGLHQTVTSGIVSALGRKNLNIASYENFIQTDASINPGNSGGALVDNQGRVIGINTAIVPRMGGGNVGIGFAIPINLALDICENLIEDGEIKRGFLGVMLGEVTEELAQAFDTKPQGALVNEVLPDSPAERAGMKAGDIVIRYGDKAVDDISHLRLMVAGADPGEVVSLIVLRDGEEKELKVELGDLANSEVAHSSSSSQPTEFLDGVRIRTLNDELRRTHGIKESHQGALVIGVDSNSAAARAGLRVGHLIVEVAQEPVGSEAEAMNAFKRKGEAKNVLLLRVETKQGSRFIAVPLEPKTD